jgi:UDP-glucose 4-epimerase
MPENHPFNNRNFYGATKIAGEAMCRAFFDRYGLNYVGLRYMNVYGPHQDQTAAYTGVIPIMLNKIEADEAPTINGDGSQAYDFISVRDVARANVLSLQSKATDKFFNVGTGVQTSIRELCDLILELTDSNLEVTYKPYSADDARRLVQNRIGCPRAAAADIGFTSQIDLRQGLLDLIQWRKEHN